MKRLPTSLFAAALLLPCGPAASAQTTFALLGGVNIASLDVSARDIIEDTVALRRMSVGLALSLPVGEASACSSGPRWRRRVEACSSVTAPGTTNPTFAPTTSK